MINSDCGANSSRLHNKQLLLLTSSYPSDITDGRAAAGFFVKDFVKVLSDLSNVTVLTQHTGEGPYIIKEQQYSVVRFPWLGESRPLSTLRLPQDILMVSSIMIAGMVASIKQIRKRKSEHIIAMWAIPCGIWALLLKILYKTPYTVWCLGADIWNYQDSSLVRPILRLVLKNAANVYADGFELRDVIKEIAQIECTYLPSTRDFKIPDNNCALNPVGVKHYLFVGRYHPNKGPDILIQAIQLLPDEIRSRIHCHLFGGGPLAGDLKLLIEKFRLEDTVTLGGFIGETELAEVLYATDVVVIPSRKDTISLMLSAALQMNKEIIASNVGDMGYVLNKYKAGNIVPTESAESFAQAIQDNLLSPGNFSDGRSRLLQTLNISNSAKIMFENIKITA